MSKWGAQNFTYVFEKRLKTTAIFTTLEAYLNYPFFDIFRRDFELL